MSVGSDIQSRTFETPSVLLLNLTFTYFYSCLSVITPPKTILSDPSATLIQVKVITVVSFIQESLSHNNK